VVFAEGQREVSGDHRSSMRDRQLIQAGIGGSSLQILS
jgi:hypothetical protein